MSGARRVTPAWTGPGPAAPPDPAAPGRPAAHRHPAPPAQRGGTFTGFLDTALQSFWNCYRELAKPPVRDVGPGAGEPERLVEPDRRGIGLLHVEHDLGQSPVPQVAQANQGQGAAQPAALLGRVDPDHVDLAHRAAPRRGTRRVDLGP